MASILIVDNDADFVQSLSEILAGHGYVTLTAYTGEDGLARTKSDKPDLILLDVMMAKDNEGFEIARRLKDDPATRAIPVILITGIRRAKQLPFGFEPDADWLPVKAVIEKPVSPEMLLREVAAALSGAI